jgi:two-component system response regulator FixJ
MKHIVFVVDDDDAVRESLKMLLECEAFEVRAFASGPEFLDDIAGGACGCAVLDIHMPVMDGFAVLEAMRSRGVALPIMLTGHGDGLVERRAQQAGVIAMLRKPVDDGELMQAIHGALGR